MVTKNEVIKAENLFDMTNVDKAREGLKSMAASAKPAGNMNYIRMNKAGVWQMGADQDEIAADEKFAVDITSWKTGYIGWNAGKVEGEHMNLLSDGPVDDSILTPISSANPMDGWKPQVSFEVKTLDGETTASIAFTSKGGRGAAATLADAINKGLEEDGKRTAPVIVLAGYSYKNKNYGNVDVFVPEYKIVDWL